MLLAPLQLSLEASLSVTASTDINYVDKVRESQSFSVSSAYWNTVHIRTHQSVVLSHNRTILARFYQSTLYKKGNLLWTLKLKPLSLKSPMTASTISRSPFSHFCHVLVVLTWLPGLSHDLGTNSSNFTQKVQQLALDYCPLISPHSDDSQNQTMTLPALNRPERVICPLTNCLLWVSHLETPQNLCRKAGPLATQATVSSLCSLMARSKAGTLASPLIFTAISLAV